MSMELREFTEFSKITFKGRYKLIKKLVTEFLAPSFFRRFENDFGFISSFGLF